MNIDREIKKIGQRLFVAHPQEQRVINAWITRNPATAREVVKETAKVLMLAKALKVSPDDADFYCECSELVSLSFIHPEVHQFFEVVSSIDLAAHKSDRMVDPATLGLIKERVTHLIRCLG